jgi:Histidine phosphatase superfamily (branch 1)
MTKEPTMSKSMPFATLMCVLIAVAAVPARAQVAPAIANAESSSPAAASALQGQALLAALRRGGYVLYFRHTATDFSKNDAGMKGYDDCANQRLLSPQGQRDATQIGERIRALRLPVGEALASPMCRTLDHARRMLKSVTLRNDVREVQSGDYAGLKRLLAAPVPPGTNRWIVGHGTPFRSIAGPPHLAEGEAAVIEPGGTRWTVVARIGVADWEGLGGGQ